MDQNYLLLNFILDLENMDFNKYYENQSKGELPGYNGQYFQRGYGFGSMFKKFVRWVIPIIRENAMPIITDKVKAIQSDVSEGLSNFHEDLKDENKSIKESANVRFNETLNKINKIRT